MRERTLYLAKPGIPGSEFYGDFYYWADNAEELSERLKADDPLWHGSMFYKPIWTVKDTCGGLPRKGFVHPKLPLN